MEPYDNLSPLPLLAHATPRPDLWKEWAKVYTQLAEDRAVRAPRWRRWALPWSPASLAPQLGPPAADAAKRADKVGHYGTVPAQAACVNGVNGDSHASLTSCERKGMTCAQMVFSLLAISVWKGGEMERQRLHS